MYIFMLVNSGYSRDVEFLFNSGAHKHEDDKAEEVTVWFIDDYVHRHSRCIC